MLMTNESSVVFHMVSMPVALVSSRKAFLIGSMLHSTASSSRSYCWNEYSTAFARVTM